MKIVLGWIYGFSMWVSREENPVTSKIWDGCQLEACVKFVILVS